MVINQARFDTHVHNVHGAVLLSHLLRSYSWSEADRHHKVLFDLCKGEIVSLSFSFAHVDPLRSCESSLSSCLRSSVLNATWIAG